MGKSAHREMQDAIQDGYNRGQNDMRDAILIWLMERMEQPEFAVVETAYRADWCAPQSEEGKQE
jgi:hypothetical protein